MSIFFDTSHTFDMVSIRVDIGQIVTCVTPVGTCHNPDMTQHRVTHLIPCDILRAS